MTRFGTNPLLVLVLAMAGCGGGSDEPAAPAMSTAEVRAELQQRFDERLASLEEALSHIDELEPDPSRACPVELGYDRVPFSEAAPTWAEARRPTFPEPRFPLVSSIGAPRPVTSASSPHILEAFRFPRVVALVRTDEVADTDVDLEARTFAGGPSSGTVAVYDGREEAIVCLGRYDLTLPDTVTVQQERAPEPSPTALGQARAQQADSYNQASARVGIAEALRASFVRQMQTNMFAVREASAE
ncbi:MAG: hypothetical protein KC619_20620 [Myxococcales bacterium]|nr:hypothetical protein [Myxococcales bacterium]